MEEAKKLENLTVVQQSTPEAALYRALAKAQSEIRFAIKGSENPQFKKRYADLASVWEACRDALTKNGLSIIQNPISDGARVGCQTTLCHESGVSVRSEILWTTPRDQGPQAIGSCVTYLRRYQLAAMVGVAPDDDDDGESAEGRLVRGNDDRNYRERMAESDRPKGVTSAKPTVPAPSKAPPTPSAPAAGIERMAEPPGPDFDPKRRPLPGPADYLQADHPSMAPRDVGGEKVTKEQLAEIHILKKAINWDDWPANSDIPVGLPYSNWPVYRKAVGAYRKNANGDRCARANELQRHQAENLIKRMRADDARKKRKEAEMRGQEGTNLAHALGQYTNIDDIFDAAFPIAAGERHWLQPFGYDSRADIPEGRHGSFIALLQAFKQGGDVYRKALAVFDMEKGLAPR